MEEGDKMKYIETEKSSEANHYLKGNEFLLAMNMKYDDVKLNELRDLTLMYTFIPFF